MWREEGVPVDFTELKEYYNEFEMGNGFYGILSKKRDFFLNIGSSERPRREGQSSLSFDINFNWNIFRGAKISRSKNRTILVF